MITTREVNVDLAKEKLKLRQVTTKNVDASTRVEPPKAKIKPRGVSTTTQADVADIAEKKRRDDIAIEKKLMIKDAKKLAQKKEKEKKKPWKLMTGAEKKVEMKKRAMKAKATRARKKKEKENESKDKKD